LYIVGPPPVASSTAFDQQHAGERAVGGGDEVERAMLLQPVDAARPHLLGQAVDDLDAGQVALVHGAVEGLAGEGLLVHRAVRIAVEEAAELVLELVDPFDGAVDQRPGEVLVRQPLAALDRVHEVALDRIAGRQRDVVAALDHARAAALAEQALHGDGHVQRGIGAMRVQRREQSGAAGAEDEEVGLEAFDHGQGSPGRLPCARGPAARVAALNPGTGAGCPAPPAPRRASPWRRR
jgi:hypothetical protein